jgi:hypothetical protein
MEDETMFRRPFRRGEPVVYAKDKWSTCPGPRAHEVHPARCGEGYLYKVDKFWMIAEDERDGTVLLVTRRGRTHRVEVADPRLHHANLWQRLRYRHKFPQPTVLMDRDGSDVSVSHA